MRLAGPQRDTYLTNLRGFYTRGTVRRQKLLKAFTVLFITTIIVGGLFAYRQSNKPSNVSPGKAENADEVTIRTFKRSTLPDDKRILVSAYTNKGDYSSALEVAKQIANQTKTAEDYLGVLVICAVRNVPNKDACFDESVRNLQPFIGTLSFLSAYSAGGMLENAGKKKEAVSFYQRAYDVYDPSADGENGLTKEQLKSRIDELR